MRYIFILATLLILPGCATFSTPKSRQAYINSHPEISQEVKTAILEKKIISGMTKEEVEASWGKPNSEYIMQAPFGTSEQWEYADANFVHFTNGKFDIIQQTKNNNIY